MSSTPSICLHVTTEEQLNKFSWNLIADSQNIVYIKYNLDSG
jgi:hypothetical protein